MPTTDGFISVESLMEDLSRVNLTGIHWVIVGGASGPKAGPMKFDWADRTKADQRDCLTPEIKSYRFVSKFRKTFFLEIAESDLLELSTI